MELPQASLTYSLIIANIIVSLWALYFDDGFTEQFSFHIGGLKRYKQHYRVFTSAFLHVDILHLSFNMLSLYFFGPSIEIFMGKLGFLVVYFGSILGCGIYSYYMNQRDYTYSSIGASGAVSGVIFSFIVFEPFASIYLLFIPIGIPAFLFGIMFILISTLLMKNENRRVSHEGHIGGAVAGFILTLMMFPNALSGWFG